ncbi:hypothetical protein GCK32_017424 [Trichostrongylus colubriformis]|uniref:G-protein coupled receptors family 1 profile domain-containing protein n=1 Tax=Trichostrongylus colubriformis TaxID=6319 RepID=A0AAN8IYA5_TRICO
MVQRVLKCVWRELPLFSLFYRQCTPLWTTFIYEKFKELNSPNISSTEKAKIDKEVMDMQRLEKMYNINHLLFVFWIPTIIIVISYLTVLLILQGHLKEEYHGLPSMSAVSQIDEEPSNCSLKGKRGFLESHPMKSTSKLRCANNPGSMAVTTIHKAKQHAKRQAAWIILAYLTFWSPYNVWAVVNMTRTVSEHQMSAVTLTFLNAAICVNPIVNPLIYGILSKSGKQ